MAEDEDLVRGLNATRLLAFRSVTQDSKEADYIYRYIMRWYSREFHTPLHVVEELPVEDVLQHFFECRYEQMEDHALEEESNDLRMTPEQRAAKAKSDEADAEDDDMFHEMVQKKRAVQDANAPPTDAASADDEPAIPVPVMGQRLPTTFQELASKVEVKEIPEGIEMKFVDDDEMEDLASWDILGPAKKDQK